MSIINRLTALEQAVSSIQAGSNSTLALQIAAIANELGITLPNTPQATNSFNTASSISSPVTRS